MLGEIVGDISAPPRSGSLERTEKTDATPARHGSQPGGPDQAPGRLVRALPGRGARGRGARGPGPGRAVRHPRRLRASERPASCWWTARRSRSAIPPTPSEPVSSTSPADRAEALLMQRSVRENIALPVLDAAHDAGDRSTSVPRRQGGWRDRDPPDRHARGARGSPPVRWQPAEGDDRPLGRRRRQDDAVLRPDAGHRHPDQAPDLRAAARPCARPAPPSCCTPPSSRRSSSSCDRAIVIFGGRVVAEIDAADADEPALLRAAYNLRSGCGDPGGCRGRGRRGVEADEPARGPPSATPVEASDG